MTEIDDLAKEIATIKSQVETLTRTSGIANTSLSEAGETTALSDTVVAAQESADTLPGFQDLLDANEEAVSANKDAVDAAIAAATQAGLDGVAAGELASDAADTANANADTANAAAVDAKTRADAAKAAADAAGITAGNASSAAATAQAAAQAADTKAVNAQTAASNAASAAASAQSAASDANTAALNAAGIANGKGRVIYSTSAPTGADQNANNLWINLSGGANTPNQWNGSAWVTVTDKAATDAAAAAATAKSAADSAKAAADAAQSTANGAVSAATAAQTTANGKNQVTYSTATPTAASNPGTRAGDIWFVRNGNGWLSAQYEWSGSDWVLRTLDSAIIAYLDAGKITAGTISADRIGTNSITAVKLAADSVTSNAILAGTIQAVDIASGTITGDRIAAATLTASLIMADTLTSREIGADAILARNIKAGQVTAAAIAASTITGDKIAANTVTAGNIAAGTITANEIQAGTITATQINLDSLTGKVLTGATLQTAASGNRVVIDAGTVSQVSGVVGRISFLSQGSTPTNQSGVWMVPSIYGNSVDIGPIGQAPDTSIGSPLRQGQGGLNANSRVNIRTRYMELSDQLSVPQIIDYGTNKVLLDDSGWRNLGMPSGFTADGALNAQVRRVGQLVKLRGQINVNSGSLVTNTTIALLGSSQFGPSQALWFNVPTGATTWARLRILPDGGISIQGLSGTATYVQLDSITFMVDITAPYGPIPYP